MDLITETRTEIWDCSKYDYTVAIYYIAMSLARCRYLIISTTILTKIANTSNTEQLQQ